MKNITKVKTVLILIMAIILLAMPVNVFAATSDTTDLNDYLDGWENLELEEDEEQTNTTPSTDTTTPTTPSTDTNTDKNETLPDAGLAEDTIMVVAIIVLGTTAIYAYGKINKYNNI